MIWLVSLAIIVLAFLLALRSMRDYQDRPAKNLNYNLFLLKNTHQIDAQFLEQLYSWAKKLNCLISFERLVKGGEQVLVVYAPRSILVDFPNLDLLELEDYLAGLGQVYAWVLVEGEKARDVKSAASFFQSINLGEDQRLFWQLVLFPARGLDKGFQVSLRVMVVEAGSSKRMILVKKINKQIESQLGLQKQENNLPSTAIVTDFRHRSIIPQQVLKFILLPKEVLEMLAVSG